MGGQLKSDTYVYNSLFFVSENLLILCEYARYYQRAGSAQKFVVFIGDRTLGSKFGYEGGADYYDGELKRANKANSQKYADLHQILGTKLKWFLCPPPLFDKNSPRNNLRRVLL